MKKVIVGLLVFIVVVFAALLVVPIAFKDTILTKVKTEINNQVDATVSFADFNLSLFKSFPDITMNLDDLTIVGKEKFKADTLVEVPSFIVTIDLADVLSGSVNISEILVESPTVFAKIDSLGHANFDIVKSSSTEVAKDSDIESDSEGGVVLQISNFKINNASIRYQDDSSKMVANVDGLDFSLMGDFSAAESNLSISSAVKALSFSMDGADYLTAIPIETNINLFANFNTSTYTLKENSLKVDEVLLNLKGDVQVKDESIATNIVFDAPETTFKNLLKLVPEFILKDP